MPYILVVPAVLVFLFFLLNALEFIISIIMGLYYSFCEKFILNK